MSGGSFSITKDFGGGWRWIGTSSSSIEDRDGEVVSAQALELASQEMRDAGRFGPLLWWHMAEIGVDEEGEPVLVGAMQLGTCDFSMRVGPFLMESGIVIDPEVAMALQDKADELAFSIQFAYLKEWRDDSGVYSRVRILERSILPRGRESNRYTTLIL